MTSNQILIIGAGFGGIGMAIKLSHAGIHDFTLLERADDLGGVWRDNHYPGAACDVPSHLYSFSFEPNPAWSRDFANQGEILGYLERCAEKYRVAERIQYGTDVTGARYDERARRWEITTNRGTLHARVLILATGGLSRPSLPDIPGLASFGGTIFHTAEWDDDADLTDKRIGVIGTGASAIQIVPRITERARHLSLFQRTAPWVLPKDDGPIARVWQALYRVVPLLQWLSRQWIYWTSELRVIVFTKRADLLEKHGERMARAHLGAQVADPVLREKLTPTFRMGCKRILLSNDYYPALCQPHVDVVTSAIRSITPDGVVTDDGAKHDLDALVLATGFHAADGGPPFPITGRDDTDLSTQWRDGAEAYLGTTVPSFPNLFWLAGPNTGLSHSSMIFMLESAIAYVVDALLKMSEHDLVEVEVTRSACDAYNQEIQARMAGTVWMSGCSSYYLTSTGKNVAMWPGFTFEYRRRTRRFDLRRYRTTAARAEGRHDADGAPTVDLQPMA